MATFPYTPTFPDGIAYPAIPTGSTTVSVSSSAQLSTALTNATAGQRIVLAGGTYSGSFTLAKQGTPSAGISIEAANRGTAIFAAGSTLLLNNAAYVTVSGLVFPYELTSGSTVAFRGTSRHCRLTRCIFGPTAIGTPGANKTPYVFGSDSAEFIRVDHNEFRNKTNPGNAVLFDGNFSTNQVCRHIRIDHNLWRSIKPEVDNEKEPLRLGVSTMSKTMSHSVIERNVFVDCIAEPEIVSAKAGSIRISGNTVQRSIGGLVYRHGIGGVMSDNYIVDDQGSAPPPAPGGPSSWGTPLANSDEFSYSGAAASAKWDVLTGTASNGFGTRSAARVTVNGSAMVVTGVAGTAQAGAVLHTSWQRYGRWAARVRSTTTGTTNSNHYRVNLMLWPADGVLVPRTTEQDVDPDDSPETPWPHTPGLPGERVKVHFTLSGLSTRYQNLVRQACDIWSRSSVVEAVAVNACPTGSNCCTVSTKPIGSDADTDGEADSTDSGGVRRSSKITLYTDWMNGYADSEALAVIVHEMGHVFGLVHRLNPNDLMHESTDENTSPIPDLIDYENLAAIYRAGAGAQYGFLEATQAGQADAVVTLRYPRLSGSVTTETLTVPGLDLSQWHEFAIEWLPGEVVVWIDGVERLRRSGGANSSRRDLQNHRGPMRLAAQLDATAASGMRASQMEVEWARMWSL